MENTRLNKNLQILILQSLTTHILGSKLDATPLTPAYFHIKRFTASYQCKAFTLETHFTLVYIFVKIIMVEFTVLPFL